MPASKNAIQSTYSLVRNRLDLSISILLMIGLFLSKYAAYAETTTSENYRTIAILDVTEKNGESTKNVYSLEYICKTIGIPYFITKDVSVAVSYPILIVCSDIVERTFQSAETALLIKYVDNGGVLIAPYVSNKNVLTLFGISSCTTTQKHHTLTWTDFTETALRWIDDPLERTMSLGRSSYASVMNSCSYKLTTAIPLAIFQEDATVGIARNSYGKGFAYSLGFSFQALIFMPQTNNDGDAQRTYSSGFEPTSDVVLLFIKGIYAKYIKYATWKHTAPYNNVPIFVLTHDVDCKEAMELINTFADWEKICNIHATYFITTHYISDTQDHDYYTPYIMKVDSVDKKGFEIGSHSVGHFPDFQKLPLGQSGNTKSNYSPKYQSSATIGGTIFGECEVSKYLLENDAHLKVSTFRPGYLLYPNEVGIALDSLGYKQSSINSANDVLTNFPYYLSKVRAKSSDISKVLEVPISWFTDPTPIEKIDSLINSLKDISKRVYANYAPFVVLIHPTNFYKFKVQIELIRSLSPNIEYMSVDELGQYWRNREAFKYSQSIKNDSMVITIPDSTYPFDDRLSIVVNNGRDLKSLLVQKQDGKSIKALKSNFESNDLIVYFSEKEIFTGIQNNKLPEIQLSMSAYPNPFTSQTTIGFVLPEESPVKLDIYDMSGRLVSTLLDQRMTPGLHQVVYVPNNARTGLYLCRLTTNKGFIVKKIMLIN